MSTPGSPAGGPADNNLGNVDIDIDNFVLNHSEDSTQVLDTTSPGIPAESGQLDTTEIGIAAVDSNSTDTESTGGVTASDINEAGSESLVNITSTDNNQDSSIGETNESQSDDAVTIGNVGSTVGNQSTTNATPEGIVAGTAEFYVPETQGGITASATQENSSHETTGIPSNAETVVPSAQTGANVQDDEFDDNSSDVTVVATAIDLTDLDVLGEQMARLQTNTLRADDMDTPRAILEGGQNVHIEVTTVGEEYTTPQYSPIVIFDTNGDEIRTIGPDSGERQPFTHEAHPNNASAGVNEGPGDHQSDIFSSGPSSIAGDSHVEGSTTLNDETISNASLPTIDADPDGPYEPEDFYPRGGNFINQDFVAINPLLYPTEDRQAGPDAHGPVVTIVVGDTSINVHHNLLGYSQKFQGQYREGNAIRNRVRVMGDSVESWKLISMAMYSQEWHPTRTNFSAPDFVEAVIVARRWGFAGPVEHNLKEMMRRYFSYLAHWKGVHLNGLTADFHMTLIKEINEAFIMCKSIREPKPYPLSAFGLVVLKLCPPTAWTAYSNGMDPALFKQIADAAIRDQNMVTFMSIETSLLSSF